MLELKYEEVIHLDKWDIDIIPYLTIENISNIINDLIQCNYGLERDMKLIADILVACTNLYDGEEDVHYTYEQILYSGLWDDILDACPRLKENIDVINREVNDLLSIERSVINFIDMLTSKVQSIDISKLDNDKIIEALNLLTSKLGE